MSRRPAGWRRFETMPSGRHGGLSPTFRGPGFEASLHAEQRAPVLGNEPHLPHGGDGGELLFADP